MQLQKAKDEEKCKTHSELSGVLSDECKSQHNERIVTSKKNENAKEWIGCLKLKANESGYKEKNRRLKEQFINDNNIC